MVHYDSDELVYILVTGKDEFDISNEGRLFDSLVSKKIQELSNDLIVGFLEYQFKNTSFPYAFTSILYNYGTNNIWLPDEEKRIVVKNWISQLFPFHISELGILIDVFLRYGSLPFQRNIIEKLLEDKNDLVKIQLLEMGITLSKEGIEIHRNFCNNMNCAHEQDFIKKTDFAERIIHNSQTKNESIRIDPIVWNGTQKELGELFKELKENGWIDEYNYKTIKACFTQSNSIDQVLKPFTDKRTKEDKYENIYFKNYSPKFHGILKNEKQSK